MLRATNRYAGDGVTTSFTITFVDGYRKREDVKAYVEDKATKVRTPVTLTFLTDFQVTVPTAPTVDETLVIYRATPDAALVDFTQTQRLSEATLNTATRQAIFKANEAMDASDQTEKDELLAAIDTVMSRVDDAGNSATAAASSATAALNAQTAAENARDAVIAAKNSGMHCKLVWSTVDYIVGLVRWGGKTMLISGEDREIPAGGVTITIPNDSSVRNVYAYWNGSAIALEQSTTVPVWLDSQGYWVKTGDSSRTYLGSARGDGLVASSHERYLRSAWNERTLAIRQGIVAQTGTWSGTVYQLAYGGFLALPGDTLEIAGNVNIQSTPAERLGDFNIGLASLGLELTKDRKSFPLAYHWNGFFAAWKGMRGINDPPQWVDPYAEFWAVNTTSGNWKTRLPESDALLYSAEPAF